MGYAALIAYGAITVSGLALARVIYVADARAVKRLEVERRKTA